MPSRKNISVSPRFLTCTGPRAVSAKNGRTSSAVSADTLMRPGSPASSMRAATLTASPQTS
jgi:hypothetical protein